MTIFLILLFVTAIWAAFAAWLSKIVTSSIPSETWRIPVAVLIFAALLPIPLIDEIVGARQFAQLCRENSKIRVDREKAAGKTVFLSRTPDIYIEDMWVNVVIKPWRFVDATSGETLVSYNTLMAGGGLLIKTLGISEGGVPLTFKGYCAPKDPPASVRGFRLFGIDYIEPPLNGKGTPK